MTNENNGAARAALTADRALARDLIVFKLQHELFQHALKEHHDAVEALVQRQVNEIPLVDEPDYRLNLIRDISAVHMALQGITVHGRELLAAIEKVMPVNPASSQA
jgi:hypothetical protein